MKQTCILSPDRQLTEDERSLVWEKTPSHIESEAEKRIYQEVVRNWNRAEMKISTILLEGDGEISLSSEEHVALVRYISLTRQIEESERR